ncbi:MAG: glycosyltransferase family 2 protein [Myxococcota bacterium]|nr:glycosyltransferase family 2 protein [Myxococcota bacterium]
MSVEISVVVPLLDERQNLAPLLDGVRAALEETGRPYEVLFVDDGSRDGSFEVLEELHEKHPEVRVIQFRRNFGKAAAYAAGFRHARGAVIATLDADLQDDPAEIPRMLGELEAGADLVTGWRRERADRAGKRRLSQFFNAVTRAASGLELHDFNCGLRVMRREVADSLRLQGELHRFVPALAHVQGFQVAERPVRHHPRRFHETKYGLGRLPKGLLDLVTVIVIGRFLERPLHLFGTVGLALGTVGMAINAYIALLWLEAGHIQSRHPLLLLGILLTVLGVQFLCTGLLAELVARLARPESDPIRRQLD